MSTNDGDPRGPGRPRRGEAPAVDEAALDRLLVHGEEVEGSGGRRRREFPSYRELAERFGISKSLVGRYASQHNCLGRRREARRADGEPEESQDAAATRLDEALDAADGTGIGVDRILRLAESWLRQLEDAIDEGRLKPDLADLERLLRVIREAKAEPDERARIPEGMPTLDDLQRLYAENERRAREETPAMQGRLPHGTIPISWVQANEAQLRAKLAALEAKDGG